VNLPDAFLKVRANVDNFFELANISLKNLSFFWKDRIFARFLIQFIIAWQLPQRNFC
jgi:hypothetical protein